MDPILVGDPDTEKYKKLVEEYIAQTKGNIHIHDFRILSGKEHVNVIFDMIVPNEIDNEEEHRKIKDELYAFIHNRYGKEVHLVINFDPAITDLLSGTMAEK